MRAMPQSARQNVTGGRKTPSMRLMKTSPVSSSQVLRPAVLALALVLAGGLARNLHAADETNQPASAYPKIEPIDPPENGFFTKVLSFNGILIKAPAVVVDDAMYRAYDRMALETARIPMADRK